ncbi:MAG: hypothetical protein WEB63_10585 [Cucumibacter sp.]
MTQIGDERAPIGAGLDQDGLGLIFSGQPNHRLAPGRGWRVTPESDALECVFAHACDLDMTRRDLRSAAKHQGRRREVGKIFEFSATCTSLLRPLEVGHPTKSEICLDVNGTRRQTGGSGRPYPLTCSVARSSSSNVVVAGADRTASRLWKVGKAFE